MKTKLILGLTMLGSVAAFAQENDDLYFRSKDREKLEAQRASEQTYVSNYNNFKKKHFEEPTELDEYTNPTDSYSARNVNPEYISRSYSDQVSEDEANYFVEGYAPSTNNFNYNSGYYYNGFNNSGWNSWYGPSYYNNWGSPYGYGWNDPWMNSYWGNRYMNPYWGNRWGSGWSLSASYYWGNSWGNSWGNPWGWYDPYCSPYNSWGSWSSWNYGGWWNAPTTVVVVGDGARPNYGKRPTRSSAGVTEVTNAYVRPSRSTNSTIDSGNGDAGGRNKTSTDYYVRPNRRTTNTTNSSNWNNTSTVRESRSSTFSSPTRSTSSGSNNNSGYSPTRSSSSSSGNNNSYSPSRSSSSGNSGYTPSRSSSSGSSGSSSGSSSRPSRGGN